MKEKNVVVVFPRDAWETISQTIECDMNSSAFDRKLRKEIRRDWDRRELFCFEGVPLKAIMKRIDWIVSDYALEKGVRKWKKK